MIAHCAEAYWTNLLKSSKVRDNEFMTLPAMEKYGNGKVGPALYKHPVLMKLSEEAFAAGKTSFTTQAEDSRKTVTVTTEIPKDVWNDYVNGIFTKTVCECRNRNQLDKASVLAREQNLVEGIDYGYIRDRCLTDLTPENEDGTTTVGMWFRPLPDEVAHAISKKFPLYRE